MTGSECTAARERAEALALGALDGAERAEVLRHLAGCPACQAVIRDHTAVVDALALLAPEAEPPPGFDRRVLAAMGGTSVSRWRRRVAVVAATAAAAAIVAVVVVRVVDAGRDDGPVAAPALVTVPMEAPSGGHVGRVTVAKGDPAQLAVSVDYAVPDGTYALELRPARGVAARLGTVRVHEGRGEWHGPAPPDAGSPGTLAMVDATGRAVCEADLRFT